MCLAVPGKVVAVEKREVEVDYPGVGVRKAMSGGEDLSIGDYVMVQMGIVVRAVEPLEAKEMLKGWQSEE